MINTKEMKVEDWVEHCAEVCDSVEFLHGVPVKLPSETKALLRGRVRKALTTYAQQIREERDREVMKTKKITIRQSDGGIHTIILEEGEEILTLTQPITNEDNLK